MLSLQSLTHINIHVAAGVSLAIGMIFSPWSSGLYFYLIYLVFYEIFTVVTCEEWDIFDRLYIVVMGAIGWVIGRLIFRVLRPEDRN